MDPSPTSSRSALRSAHGTANLALAAAEVFDALDLPVSVFSDDGRYVYINREGQLLLGKSSEDLLGHTYLDVFPDLVAHPFHEAFVRVASGTCALLRLEFQYQPLGRWSRQRILRTGPWVAVFWEDITAQKQAELRATENERLFRTMVEWMPQLAWTARADGYIDYYNPRWYEYTGTTAKDMEGWGWQSVHDPVTLPAVMDRWQQSIATGKPFEMEFPLRGRDGSFRWFLTRIAPILDELGGVTRWVGINTDVNEQKVAIQRLNDTLESMGDAFLLLDPDYRIILVNGNQELVSHTKREATLGRVFWDVFPATRNPASKYWTEYHRAMEERTAVHFVEHYAPLNMWTEVDAYPAQDGGVAIFFRDVSERKRSEQALELLVGTSAALASSLDYAETLARIVEAAVPSLADVCSVHLLARDGSVEQLAVSRGDGESADLVRLLDREGAFAAEEPFGHLRVIRTGQTELVLDVPDGLYERAARSPAQLELLKKFGARSWIVVALGVDARRLGVIAFTFTGDRCYGARDAPLAEEIARRASLAIENARLYRDAKVAYEAERRARDRAEDATRLKDEFLATLSHELRTPLNAILGWGRMLQSGVLDATKQVRALETIVRNATAQSQLIDDLLDVSRIITGKLRLSVGQVDVKHVVEVALEVIQPAAEAKGIRIQAVLDPDAGLTGDAGRLQQVVSNLLTNAIKFTSSGGHVDVTLGREESNLTISVADTGVGIPELFLPYVFDRFRQQDGAITRKTGGLGLGLAIVKNLVELHGGSVQVHSDGEGQGATFVVKLPIAPLRSTRATDSSGRAKGSPMRFEGPHASKIAGLNVLVVDDERDARDLVRALLEQCKAVVTAVSNANDALDMIRRLKPDVIVSDIGMPEIDGYSFIRQVRALSRDEGGRIPAVALTAFARPEDRHRALVEGFQSHAAKPIDPEELLVVIANLAGRSV